MTESESGYLEFASDLATHAHKIAVKYFNRVCAEYKVDNSPVTIADIEINSLVASSVTNMFPECGLIGEEESFSTDRELLWICDPLDGTRAFLSGIPTFHFSLALVFRGRPIFALISDLVSNNMVWAFTGKGAFDASGQVFVSQKSLKESLLGVGALSYLVENPDVYRTLKASCKGMEFIHGCVVKGSLIARGILGASVSGAAKSWDYAAIDLIVTEAGGKLTYLDGSVPDYSNYLVKEVVVSNGVSHDELCDILR
jgi:fructose-1,6-bisphosphatase/inositol monophosphatase family enzyme